MKITGNPPTKSEIIEPEKWVIEVYNFGKKPSEVWHITMQKKIKRNDIPFLTGIWKFKKIKML